jgi:ATP-dependent DNA helicase DinG
MRQRAAEADIVIVNHHLLCADAAVRQSAYGQVIPDCHYAVIDEAHQLEDVATQYFGIAVSNFRVEEIARDGERLLAADGIPDAEHADVIREILGRLRDHGRAYFVSLQTIRSSPGGFQLGASSDERIRVTGTMLLPASDAASRLIAALDQLETTLSLVRDLSEDGVALSGRASDLARELRFLQRASDPDYVYFVEWRGRGVFLRAAPIDVSRIVRELLLDRLNATVLTSATLSVADSFAHVRSRLGVSAGREVRLPSEFDYAAQSILYLPSKMPDPRSPQFAAAAAKEILEILRRTQGRAFVLFTSYAMLRDVRDEIEFELEYPLFVQGDAPRSALLRDFRVTPHAVLLATSSFWQGVDVVGEALSCVIIDKLPFASPADPITAARIEALRERGSDAFNDYQVPVAVLALLQGLGRLIRHRNDRGVLAVLDPRLRTKGYGRRFLESLPPAPLTSDLSALTRFFAGS